MDIKNSEKQKAFHIWYSYFHSIVEDPPLAPYLHEGIKAAKFPKRGWLRKSRESLLLSAKTVSDRLQISQAAYSKYEENEENGRISLNTLARAAESMNCELVYAIRPRNKRVFSEIIWNKLLPVSCRHPWLKACDSRKRPEALAAVAQRCMIDSEFRRKQGWSQKGH